MLIKLHFEILLFALLVSFNKLQCIYKQQFPSEF